MIVKGSRRAGSHQDAEALLDHLMHGAGNERIVEITGAGAVTDLVNDARAFAIGDRKHAVWHISISPELEISETQWARSRELLLEAYKTREDLPTASVRHFKPHRQTIRNKLPARPPHEHIVFGTTDPITGRQIDPYMHYLIHERVARQLEWEFGHPLIKGKFNKQVHAWFAVHGKSEIADAMETAGLLEGEPGLSKISDRERNLAIRKKRDPFLAVDASASALAKANCSPPELRARVFRQHFADEGFVLARGEGRLVLVSVDGLSKPVSASRKLGIRDAELRDLLDDEFERLPKLSKGAKISSWLLDLSKIAITPPQQGKASNHAAHKDHPPLQYRQTSEYPGWGGSRRAVVNGSKRANSNGIRSDRGSHNDRLGAQRDPRTQEASRGRGEPAGSGGRVASDLGLRSGASETRGASDLNRSGSHASETSRPSRFEQARLTRVSEQHLHSHRDTISSLLEQVRQAPDPARVRHLAEQIIAERCRTAAAIHVLDPKPQIRGIQLSDADLGHPLASEHKKTWILVAIRQRYNTGWLPPDVVQNIVNYRYDRQAEEVWLTLDNGAVIRDGITRISLEGQVDGISVDELVAVVERRGWASVDLIGDLAFQRAVALGLAILEPPVTVVGSQLSDEDIKEIEGIRLADQPDTITEPLCGTASVRIWI